MEIKEIIQEVSEKMRVAIAATVVTMKVKNKETGESEINDMADITDEITKAVIDKIESLGYKSPEKNSLVVLSVANVLIDTVENYLRDNDIDIDIDIEIEEESKEAEVPEKTQKEPDNNMYW